MTASRTSGGRSRGTILADDKDAYLAFEDTFALLGNAAETSDRAKADGVRLLGLLVAVTT